MGAAYHILGRTVQPHQLAIATLGTVVFSLYQNHGVQHNQPLHQLMLLLQKKKNTFKIS